MWNSAKLASALRSRQFEIGLAAGMGALGGAIGGYAAANKRLKTKYEQIAEQEIAEAKKFYSALKEKPSPIDLAQKYEAEEASKGEEQTRSDEQILKDAIVELGYLQDDAGTAVEFKDLPKASQEHVLEHVAHDEPGYQEQIEGRILEKAEVQSISLDKEPNAFGETIQVTETKVTNIFTEGRSSVDEDFDWEEEERNRSTERPYILHHDEFYQAEKDYEQVSLTYFEEDDVLVDERDSPIPDTERTVGNANLLRFGYGSKDQNVVYIRNDRLEVDFEVVRSQGSYAKEVLGFIQHSDKPVRVRRFRSDDG